MQKLALLFIGLVACLFISCSDSSSPNDTGNNNGGDGVGVNDFQIVSIDRDTVYWGEWVNVTIRNAKNRTLALFVHTVPAKIDNIWLDTSGNGVIRFQVPVNASSGQIRLFNDTVQAKKAPSLVILEKVLSEMRPQVTYFAPGRAYPGDLVVITGVDIPLRRSEMSVRIDDKLFEIVGWDSLRIFTRVPKGAHSGMVIVRLFDNTWEAGTLEVFKHDRALLNEKKVSRVRLYIARIQGALRIENIVGQDTSIQSGIAALEFSSIWTVPPTPQLPFTDSIIFTGERDNGDEIERVEIRLKPEAESRASGIVRYTTGNEIRRSVTEVEIKNMRWMFTEGRYMFYTHSSDLPKELAALTLIDTYEPTASEKVLQTISIGNTEVTSVINIDMWP